MLSSVLLCAALTNWAGPPPEPTLTPTPSETVPKVLGPPERTTRGTALLAVGGSLKVLSLGAGITGIAWGRGGPAVLLLLASIGPSTLGGGLLVTGSWLRGRHQGWYAEEDLSLRARKARRVGWPLFGVGLGLLVGSSVAIGVWPYEECIADEGCAARYLGAFRTVEAVFVVAPLLIGAGASALTWSTTYGRARGYRLELQPTVGGLSLRF